MTLSILFIKCIKFYFIEFPEKLGEFGLIDLNIFSPKAL